ncbi:MAG TPA: toxin-antitoxin (TA) system antitoxin [Blastocatellia bacterium]|jgi:antitoxin (DNA-binding transcriptional repressor) of toxin-antitoxin stability system
MTKTVDVFEVQNDLAGILSLIAEGTEIILTSNDKPVARLVPITAPETRVAGLHEGKIWTSDDFAEPLPDEFWTNNS